MDYRRSVIINSPQALKNLTNAPDGARACCLNEDHAWYVVKDGQWVPMTELVAKPVVPIKELEVSVEEAPKKKTTRKKKGE